MSETRGVAELAVAQPRHRVVFVEALLRLGGGLDVPGQQRRIERLGDFLGQHGLAGAGLALDQQRALQHDRGVDGDLEVVGGDIVLGAGKFHRAFALLFVLERRSAPRSEQETTACAAVVSGNEVSSGPSDQREDDEHDHAADGGVDDRADVPVPRLMPSCGSSQPATSAPMMPMTILPSSPKPAPLTIRPASQPAIAPTTRPQ